MLGGSSNLNYLFYVRGDAKDYDHWHQLGNSGWSYKEVLPYFKRAEKYYKIDPNAGDLPITESIFLSPLAKAWQAMAGKHNLVKNDKNSKNYINGKNGQNDQNGDISGFATPQLNIDQNGKRADTYSSYLKPILKTRENLKIVTGATVYRVLFDEKNVAQGNLIF